MTYITTILSEKEIEAIKLISSGMSQREIAEHLNMPKTSLNNFLRELRTKTGTANSANLVSFGYEKGILKTA